MNSTFRFFTCCIISCLVASGQKVYSQDTSAFIVKPFLLDSSFETFFTWSTFDYIYHNPNKSDYKYVKRHKSLINQEPTKKTYQQYYKLACALWDVSRVEEATKIFLEIIKSKEDFYSSTYYHSSDIPGDTTTNIYGYGSFTSNYKNYSAIYLTKIYLEQKNYSEALKYLEDAVNCYKVTYNCGTGFHMQQDEYNSLYASCYEGLDRNKEIIDLLLPGCLERADDKIIRAVKKLYSPAQIHKFLNDAEYSIICELDTFPSHSYITSYNGKPEKEKTDTLEYYSGHATIVLFDKRINIPSPDLQNGEHATKEHFIKKLIGSDFYAKLKEDI